MRDGPSHIANLALLLVARGLLRVVSPLRAHATLVRVGSLLPPLNSREDVRLASRRLGRRGTCLSRSLAIAARAPAASVVIGVALPGNAPFLAHAWVEMDGGPVDPAQVMGEPIARLAGPRARGGRDTRAE